MWVNIAILGLWLFRPSTAATRMLSPTDSVAHFDLSSTTDITATVAPKNVILFIGDGMGPEQIRAAGMYQNGAAGTLVMESFPYSSTMTTHSADSAVTDSAAAATAMATGFKVNNYVISQAIPGEGHDLETVAELFHRYCKRVGLATTTYATHATPAGFGAHEPNRNNLVQIAGDYLAQSRPNILFGGGANGLTPTAVIAAGYTVITDRVGLQSLDPFTVERVSGQFGVTHLPYEYQYYTGIVHGYDTLPHLSEMVSATLPLLANDPEGFFLMVEGGRIDHAGHVNLIRENVFETLEFDRAVAVAYAWVISRTDTLIIVTADHETGGLMVTGNNGAGQFPTVTWMTTTHTATPVPVYAWGVNAELTPFVHDNTDIYWLARAGLMGTPSCTVATVKMRRVQGYTSWNFAALVLLSTVWLLWRLPAARRRL
jgi:alkaline phosphatase